MSILMAAAVLGFPASAFAARVTYAGDVAGDTSPTASFTFSAKGKFTEKGKFIPAKVSGFDATVDYTCYDAAGNPVSTTKRDDLPFGLAGPTGVTRKGSFNAIAIVDGGLSGYSVTGNIRGRRATGMLAAGQMSTFNSPNPGCSTGTASDHRVQWTAKLIPPVCSATAGVRPLCSGAPRP